MNTRLWFVISNLLAVTYVHGILYARTGNRVAPMNVMDPRYDVNYFSYSPELNDIQIEPGQESVSIKDKNGQKYNCVLPAPPDENSTTASGDTDTTLAAKGTRRSAESVLDVMYGLPCDLRIEGWWTYELCYKKHLRQFHVENDNLVADFYLGRYDKEATRLAQEKGKNSFLQKSPTSTEADQRYHVQVYTGGTECDLTGKLRSTEVRYVCGMEDRSYIASIKEAPTCHYTVIYYSTQLCTHPLFQVKSLPVNRINCFAVKPEPATMSSEAEGISDLNEARILAGNLPEDAEGLSDLNEAQAHAGNLPEDAEAVPR